MAAEHNPEIVDSSAALRRTPLHGLHQELGGRMVPFAGYSMPVHYEGILAEHRWTREQAGLFDVSHMGQRFLSGPSHAAVSAALEALTPGDFDGLPLGRMRYTVLLNDSGGIVDDMMVTRSTSASDDGGLLLVFNGSRKEVDDEYIRARLPQGVSLHAMEDRALLALQGPAAAKVLARHCPKAGALDFMSGTSAEFDGMDCHVSRSGYTGEDGFEISVPARNVEAVTRALLGEPEVKPVGLGARDSLRLEAGLPLYGHDIDLTTSPVEAGLAWSIGKRRRLEGGFPGANRILGELADGATRKRVGLRPEGQAPAREGTEIQDMDGTALGTVTSGGFGPSVGGPIAMGYVQAAQAAPGAPVRLLVRGRALPASVAPMPFVPHRYKRSPKATA